MWKFIKEQWMLLVESIIALILLTLNIISPFFGNIQKIIAWTVFALIFLDILVKFYKEYTEKKEETESKRQNKKKEAKKEKDILAIKRNLHEQKEFNMKYRERKERAVKLLNKFFDNSLLNEEDILNLAKKSSYYLLYVYSWPFKFKGLKVNVSRKYPEILKDIGFHRMGKRSTLFIMPKDALKNKQYRELSKFKLFLSEIFSQARKEEFKRYALAVKEKNKKKYIELIKSKPQEFLKINFLLVEQTIHPGNIGLIDGQYIGLGSKDVTNQILQDADLKEIELDKTDKLRIKKFFNEQEFDILLEGVKQEEIKKISRHRNDLKRNLELRNVLDLSNKAIEDITLQLKNLKINNAEEIAKKMKRRAMEFKAALEELGVNL